MPFVNVRTVKGLLTEAQRQEMQDRISQVMLEIEGRGNPDFQKYIMVLIEEHDAAAWSVHGNKLTPEIVDGLVASL